MKCRGCGRELSGKMKFCKYCGTQLESQNNTNQNSSVKCRSCGTYMNLNDSFCPLCGTPVNTNNQPPKRKYIKFLLGFSLMVFFVLIGVIAIYLIHNSAIRNGDRPNDNVQNGVVLLDYSDKIIKTPEDALESIAEVSKDLGISDVYSELVYQDSNELISNTCYRFSQKYNDIPVYGRKEVVITDESRQAKLVCGNYLSVGKIDTEVKFSFSKVEKYIEEEYGVDASIVDSELVIYSMFHHTPELCWRLLIESDDIKEECFVSAIDGKELSKNPLIDSATETSTGEDSEGNIQQFATEIVDGKHYMQDNKRNIYMYDAGGDSLRYKFVFQDSNGKIYSVKNNKFVDESGNEVSIDSDSGEVKDLNGNIVGMGAELVISAATSNIFTKLEPVSLDNGKWDKKAVSVYTKLSSIYDMWSRMFHCQGFDGKNGTVYAVVNDDIRVNYIFDDNNNAYSNSCHGYPITILSFGQKVALTADIIGHEYMHSITRNRCNLMYRGESGAINEALSDIFGEISEDWVNDGTLNNNCDWKVSSYRNIAKPWEGNQSYPDQYQGKGWTDPEDLEKDNGGVHHNSTVISHAAYLMNTGINGHLCFDPLSTYEIGQLFSMTLYLLSPDCSFSELRSFTQIAADLLYEQGKLTERQRDCVHNAFFQVNVKASSIPVSKEFSLEIIGINGEKYENCKIYITNYSNKSRIELAYNRLKDDLIKLSDFGDYKIEVVDNNKKDNITSVDIHAYEKGGKKSLTIYTTCGVLSSSETQSGGEQDKNEIGHLSDEMLDSYMEIMTPIAESVIYHCIEEEESTWIPDALNNEFFWDVMCFYSNYEYDTFGFLESDEFYIVPDNVLKNAAYACFKSFNGNLPTIDNSIWRAQNNDPDSKLIVMGDSAEEITLQSYEINKDDTIDAVYSVYFWVDNEDDEPSLYYKVHFVPNPHYDNTDLNVKYRFTVDKVEQIRTNISQSDIGSKYAPYVSVIESLENEYGPIELNESDYYTYNDDAWEIDGVCYLELLDMDHDDIKELLSICKKVGDKNYKGYIYTINKGKAICLYTIDEATCYTNGAFFYLRIDKSGENDIVACQPTDRKGIITTVYGYFDNKFTDIEYQMEPSYSSTQASIYYIDGKEVNESDYSASTESHGLIYSSTDYEKFPYVRCYGKDNIDLERMKKTISDTKKEIGKK